MRMKKFLTFLLTLAMVVSMLPATAFAANNTATTMRLAKTQGTVAVTNATGKQVKQTGNMKLYNGYKIKTGAKSYAWISLDNTKAAKLDANSVVSVQKSGQKLTLYLSSGNLFFNVKDPLKSGESFHIKTSTMTTGIRGTSGCVRVINDRVTEVHLLTGQVEIYTENPALHISKTAVLKAGQKATSLIADEAMAAMGEQAGIIIEQLTHEEVCGNCSKEIAADPALVERIRQEAPHLLPEKIAAEADERLAADEKAAEEKQAAIDEKVAQQVFPEEVDPYFEEEESSGGGGGGGGSAAVDPTAIRNVATWAELLQAIKDYNDGENVQQINLTADIEAGANDEPLPEIVGTDGSDLILNLGTNVLKMNGTLVNESDLTITNTAGYLALTDEFIENIETPIVVDNSDTLTLSKGTIVVGAHSIGVYNSGSFSMKGGAIRSGSVTAENSTSNFTSSVFADSRAIVNSGTVDFSGGTIEAGTGIENSSTLSMTGGTMNLTKPDTYGIVTHGDATLSGGTINISEDAVDEQGVGATGVIASGMLENTLVMNGTDVYAESGTAVSLDAGKITLAEGSQIHALNPTASAVMTAYGDNDALIVNRPVQAEVFAVTDIDPESEEFDPFDNTIFEPLYDDGMTLTSEDNGDGTYKVTLKDTYGQVSGWTAFVTAIEEFNDGEGDVTITLEESLDPIATENANVLERYPLPAIGDSNAPDTDKKLTIALGAYDLTLPSTLYNYNNLEITGTGEITASPDNVYSLIGNGGILTLNGPKLTVPHNVVGVDNMGTFNMAGGSMELIYTTGIQNNGGGIVNLNGGTITLVEDNDNYSEGGESPIGYLAYTTLGEDAELNLNGTAIAIAEGISYYGVGTDGADFDSPPVAVYNEPGNTVTMTDGTITVGSGEGIINYGTLALTKGEITANNDAWAIDHSGEAADVSVGADMVVRAEFSGDNVFKGTLPEGYAVSDTATGGYYYLEAEESDGITTWAQLVMAVDEFNALDGNGQTVTLTLGANIPAETETSLVPMNPIASGDKHLVINLNNRGLTLPQTITVYGNLELVGGGTIDSTVTGTGAALFDVKSTGSVAMNENETGAPTIDLDMNQIAINSTQGGVYMKAGEIQLGDVPSAGINANGGYVEMSGGEILIMACGDNFANMGIEAMNGTTVKMTGGVIREGDGIKDAENDNNYAIYADGSTVDLTSGTVSVHNGAAIRVTAPSQLTLGSAVVTGKDAAKLLVVPEDVEETGFTTEAADTAGYSKLISTTTSNIIPVATADEIVAAFETVNSTDIEYIIQMTADINMEPYEENGQTVAYSPLEVMRSTDTTLDLNGKTLTLGNALTNNDTLAVTDSSTGGKITGDIAKLIVNKGDLSMEGGNITTATTGISAESGSVLLKGTGITVSGTDATGISVANGASAVMDVGISSNSNMISVSSGTGVNVASGGDFTLSSGMIRMTSANAAGVVNAGNLYLYDGSINYSSGTTRNAVENSGYVYLKDAELSSCMYTVMNSGEFVMDGGSVEANGTAGDYAAIFTQQNGITTINGGIVTGGNQYTYALQGPTGWTGAELRVNVDGATVRAEAADLVITTGHATYAASDTATDGYYTLVSNVTPTEVGSEEMFAAALEDANAGVDVIIQLTNDVTLSAYYQDAPYELGSNAGMLTIDLNNNDLILNGTLYNYGVMNIVGPGTVMGAPGFVGYTEDNELIHNFGLLTWKDATLHLANGQIGMMTHDILRMSNYAITAADTAVKENTIGVVYSRGSEFTYDSVNCAENVTFKEERLEE